jgi:hypothetical protein
MTLGARVMRFLLIVLCAALPVSSESATMPVRFTEGLTRGFLLVRAQDGRLVGHGDLIQVVHGHRVESQMILRFRDGSIHDERVTFTQDGVFALLRYHVAQGGPSFPERLDALFDVRDGRYSVTSGTGKLEKVATGQLALPADVSNGLVIPLLKNLPPGASRTVHVVAFTPKPKLVELEMLSSGQRPVQVGELQRPAERYVLKARLGPVVGFMAKLLGRLPADTECLILNADAPAFVRCDGALALGGPIWRIEVTSPADRGGLDKP